MGEAACVNVVDRLDQLLGVVTDNFLTERTRVGDIVEKLTARDKLGGNVGDWDLLAVLLVPDGVLLEFEIFDNVFVLQGLHRLNLVLEELECSLVEFWVVETEDLDGNLIAIGGLTQFDFGAEA